jgi:hypothetical protein
VARRDSAADGGERSGSSMSDRQEQEGERRPEPTKRTWGERVDLALPLINLLIAIHKIVDEWVMPLV